MPMSTKNAAIIAAILLITSIGTAVAIWQIIFQPGEPSAQNFPGTTQPSASTSTDPMAEFRRVYSLQAGEAVRWIPPPFIKGRSEFYRRQRPQQARRLPNGPTAMVISYTNDRPNLVVMRFGNGIMAQGVCRFTLGISFLDIEGREGLGAGIKGDIVFNPAASPDQILAGDEKLIRDATGFPIKLSFRNVPRPVIVFTGKWTPQYSDGKIQIYGLTKDIDYRSEVGGSGPTSNFVDRLSDWLNETVVLKATNLPASVKWLGNQTGDGTQNSADHAHDRDLVCQHIAEQTSLAWREETRSVRRLFIEKGK